MKEKRKSIEDRERRAAHVHGPAIPRGPRGQLYDRYSRTVFGVGLKILGDRSMAEELVQEVFLKVWRSSGTFDPSRGSFSTWLYRVTRSVAFDLHRKRAHKVRRVSNGDSHIAARDSSVGPEEIVDQSWLSWRISRALEALDAPHREVIELAYLSGLSQREISERTGVPLGTVKSRTARAFERLRKELAPENAFREKARREVRRDTKTRSTHISTRPTRINLTGERSYDVTSNSWSCRGQGCSGRERRLS